jgi:hypothetical protein
VTSSLAVEKDPASDTPAAQKRTKPRWLADIWLIFVFAAFGPAMVVINNQDAPYIGTAIWVVGIIVLIAVTARLVLVRLGLDARGSTYAVALATLVILNTGSLIVRFPFGRMGVIALALVATAVVYRLRGMAIVVFAFSWASLGLAIGPVVTAFQNLDLGADPGPVITGQVPPTSFVSTPDIVVIVADGYGSNSVLSRLYGFDNRGFTDALEAMGVTVEEQMRSNYARTKLSVPSFLEMGYLPEGTPITPAVESQLHQILGGENRLADAVRRNGYQTVYVESGWSGTKCSASNDVCVSNVWPDETFYDIVRRSLLRDLPGFETGISFARGAHHVLGSVRGVVDQYTSNDRPDLIYIHLLAPHPPFFHNSSCELDPEAALAGFALGEPGMAPEHLEMRKSAYVSQVQCVNSKLGDAMASIAQAGAVGLILGDHGPDLSLQLFSHADDWSEEAKAERFGVFFASYHPGCDYQSVSTLVNVGRKMLSCLSGSEIPLLVDRHFDLDKRKDRPSVVELSSPGSFE